jgi:twitching motility protein PilT
MANIDAFLWLMLEQQASDLHFIAGHEPVLRIDGNLVPVKYRPITSTECRNFVFEILPETLQQRFDQKMDADFAYQLKDQARFRVNLFQHQDGTGAVFRLIPMQIPSLEDLHLPMQLLEFPVYREGLVLVTGPSGSGKSTTLASLIDYINANSSRHILTIEDPVEFSFKHKQSLITQREIGRDVDSFQTGLKPESRGAADVILVSDLHDLETIDLVLSAAQTGSLVFTTLHSRSCVSAISHIVDSFPFREQTRIRSQLAITLHGVINQKLIQRPNRRGRVPVIELMSSSAELAHIIREGSLYQMHRYFDSADNHRNITFDQSLMSLYTSELISIETAIRHAQTPETFENLTV